MDHQLEKVPFSTSRPVFICLTVELVRDMQVFEQGEHFYCALYVIVTHTETLDNVSKFSYHLPYISELLLAATLERKTFKYYPGPKNFNFNILFQRYRNQ